MRITGFGQQAPVVSPFAGASAVYSLRVPAGGNWSGPLVNVRRDSDGAVAPIYPLSTPDANGNRWLNQAQILAHCGSGSGFVSYLYDISGNNRHVNIPNSANQHMLVNNGVYLGRLTQNATNSSTMSLPLGPFTDVSPFTLITGLGGWVAPTTAFANLDTFFRINTIVGARYWIGFDRTGRFTTRSPGNNQLWGVDFAPGTPFIYSLTKSAVANLNGFTRYINRNAGIVAPVSAVAAFTVANMDMGLIGTAGTASGVGNPSDIVFYNSVLPLADIRAIEQNIATAYGITVA